MSQWCNHFRHYSLSSGIPKCQRNELTGKAQGTSQMDLNRLMPQSRHDMWQLSSDKGTESVISLPRSICQALHQDLLIVLFTDKDIIGFHWGCDFSNVTLQVGDNPCLELPVPLYPSWLNLLNDFKIFRTEKGRMLASHWDRPRESVPNKWSN